MTGEKLPPFIIFQGVPGARNAKTVAEETLFLRGVICTVQAKAWMDSARFLEWIEKVWRPFCSSGTVSFLLMDAFQVHTTRACLEAVKQPGAFVDIIPAGYTSTLQVLDVGVNKPFRNNITHAFEAHMREGNRRVSRGQIATWILSAFTEVPTEAVVNSWRHVGMLR